MDRFRLAAAALALALAACSSSSSSPPGGQSCQAGDTWSRPCGNCGAQSSTCLGGTWSEFGPCLGQGACAAGAQETASCGSDVGACVSGTATRSCTAGCVWDSWSACGGTYLGPQAEACGNGIDDNCNGVVDELCDSLAVSGQIVKLLAAPGGTPVVYALNTAVPSQVVVLDVATRSELTRISLPQPANDMDLSPNGQHLVVSHDVVHQISVIDTSQLTLAATVPVASDPYRLEVNDAGVVYYVEYDQWVEVRRVNPAVGFSSDVLLGGWPTYEADSELSPDGAFLFLGEAYLSGSSLAKWDVSAGGMTKVDQSTWDDGYGFSYPTRYLYLSPDGKRAYYAGYQLDAANLAFTVGWLGERVLVEDQAGTFAVGESTVFDAKTLRPVGSLPRQAGCAALVNADGELWYYGVADGRIYWAPVADLLGGATLGSRAISAEPLSSYILSRLVRDPARPRLYGLDATRNLVVAIDSDTGTPLGAVLVGSTPTDLSISLAGDALWVGHWDTLALARIDLSTFSFDRFVVVPRVPYQVEALAAGRVAIIDEDQWTTPTIVDGATGAVTASASWGAYEGALASAVNGTSLFVAESSLSGSNMTRYDVSAGLLTQVGKTTYNGGYGFPYPPRRVVALPDGSAVYYAGFLIDGANLAILRYVQSDPIVTVSPDGRIGISSTKVYRVSDGAVLGTLPVSGSVQALSPDGNTLYISTPAAIAKVDLSAY